MQSRMEDVFTRGLRILLLVSLIDGLAALNIPPGRDPREGLDPPSPPEQLESRNRRAEPSSGAGAGQRGYLRYHANDSLVGQPVQCSPEEAVCFRYNMLHQKDYGCIDLSQHNAAFRSGHFVPVPRDAECDGYVMAYDDRCYREDVVRDVICGCAARPSRHFVNGVECRCSPSAAPIHVEQPEEEGRCRIPDLRFPEPGSDWSLDKRNPFKDLQGFKPFPSLVPYPQGPDLVRLSCSAEQLSCFAQSRVRVEGACHPLLQRGPCAEEHVVVLDGRAALDGRAEATCVHVRGGCPPGHVRMVFDGKCHPEDAVRLLSHGRHRVLRNQFGVFIIASPVIKSIEFHPKQGEKQTCGVEVKLRVDHGSGVYATKGQVVISKRYEVQNQPPRPE